jgi:hypothetical protein
MTFARRKLSETDTAQPLSSLTGNMLTTDQKGAIAKLGIARDAAELGIGV